MPGGVGGRGEAVGKGDGNQGTAARRGQWREGKRMQTQKVALEKLEIIILRAGQVVEVVKLDDPRESFIKIFNAQHPARDLIAALPG